MARQCSSLYWEGSLPCSSSHRKRALSSKTSWTHCNHCCHLCKISMAIYKYMDKGNHCCHSYFSWYDMSYSIVQCTVQRKPNGEAIEARECEWISNCIPHFTEHAMTYPWASCQIRKIAGAHAPGMPGTFSPSPQVSDPDMHHGTCVTHVPWCMPGSLTSGFLWNRRRGKMFPAFPAHAQPAILRIW